jgi:hypothetical protein
MAPADLRLGTPTFFDFRVWIRATHAVSQNSSVPISSSSAHSEQLYARSNAAHCLCTRFPHSPQTTDSVFATSSWQTVHRLVMSMLFVSFSQRQFSSCAPRRSEAFALSTDVSSSKQGELHRAHGEGSKEDHRADTAASAWYITRVTSADTFCTSLNSDNRIIGKRTHRLLARYSQRLLMTRDG